MFLPIKEPTKFSLKEDNYMFYIILNEKALYNYVNTYFRILYLINSHRYIFYRLLNFSKTFRIFCFCSIKSYKESDVANVPLLKIDRVFDYIFSERVK